MRGPVSNRSHARDVGLLSRAWHRALATVVLAIVVGVLLAFYLHTVGLVANVPASSDFAKFYLSAQYLRQGADIYAPMDRNVVATLGGEIPEELVVLHPNLNPPFFSVLLVPLTLLSYGQAFRLWSLAALAAGIAGALLTESMTRAGPLQPWRVLGFLAALLAFFPTWASVLLGQVSLFLLLALVLVWRWTRSGHDGAAGVVLGVAAGVKLFVALPIAYFLLRRRWRVAASAAVAGTATVVIGLIFAGPDACRSYLASTGSVTWYAASWNASLLGFFTRFLGGSENVPLVDAPWLAHGLTFCLSLAAVAGLAWLTWPRPGHSAAVCELGYGLALAMMLLLSPLGWMYYFPALLPTLLIAWREAGSRWARVLVPASALLASAPAWLLQPGDMAGITDLMWPGPAYTIGLLLLIGVLSSGLVSRRRVSLPGPGSSS